MVLRYLDGAEVLRLMVLRYILASGSEHSVHPESCPPVAREISLGSSCGEIPSVREHSGQSQRDFAQEL